MEDKKVKAGSVAVGICLFIIAILFVLIVLFLYNSNMEKNNLQQKISELEIIGEEKEEILQDDNKNINNSEDEENIITFAPNELYGIEEYIDILHPYGRSIPDFDDINKADKDWIWFTVRMLMNKAYQKSESIFISYDGITKIANMIFGDEFNGEFPKEGNHYLRYENGYYEVNGHFGWPEGYNPSYMLIDVIKQDNNVYKATIVEYIAEYVWDMDSEEQRLKAIRLYNDENYYENYEKYIKEFSNYDRVIGEIEIKEYVLKNIDKFTTKELTIKLDEDNNLNIISCKTIK